MSLRGAVWILGLAAVGNAFGQAPPEPKYGYEVVSIKKTDPGARGVRIGPGPQGGMKTMNTSLMVLITYAYDVRDYQVMDAPKWATGDGFDVTFTPDQGEAFPKPGEADVKVMDVLMDRQRQRVQAILRDRFGLKLRVETRELPVYWLSPAKGGVKLQAPEVGAKGPSMMTNPQKGETNGTAVNMRMLTNMLSNLLKQPVVDHSGVEGTFDVKLRWAPDGFVGGTDGRGPEAGAAVVTPMEGPSIFTAMSEQLGLKLEAKKGPVTVYVVEKAERPGEN
jgi:uncharacterized protein (TIGR03435 family)